MTCRLSTALAAALALSLTACPSDDAPAETEGASSSSGATDGTTTTADGTTTDAVTGDGTTGSSGTVDSTGEGATDSGSTSEATDSGSGSTDEGSSSGDSGSESSGSSGSGGMMMDACDGPEVLLYEQTPGMFDPGSPAGEGVGGFARAADDFVIPAGDQCWCITRVVLPGVYQETMLSGDLEVGFYEDAGGVPMPAPLTTDVGAPIDMAGTFDYTLGTPTILDAATYWLSAMPTIPNSIDGIWFWAPSGSSNGGHWAFESDIPMLPPACLGGWVDLETCAAPSPFLHDDNAFEIYGVVGGDACM